MYITAYIGTHHRSVAEESASHDSYIVIYNNAVDAASRVGIRCALQCISFIIEFYVVVLTTHKIHVRLLIKIICIY